MKDYREISSDDEPAWKLQEKELIGYHIAILILIIVAFVLFSGFIYLRH